MTNIDHDIWRAAYQAGWEERDAQLQNKSASTQPDRLTALEMIQRAQNQLELGNFGTVRMLLIHARRSLIQELHEVRT